MSPPPALLLGLSLWPYSEQVFLQALVLRTEQERTQQERLRLEATQLLTALVRQCSEAGILPLQIPQVLATVNRRDSASETKLPPILPPPRNALPEPAFTYPPKFVYPKHNRSLTASSPGELSPEKVLLNVLPSQQLRKRHMRTQSVPMSPPKGVLSGSRPAMVVRPPGGLQFHHYKPGDEEDVKRRDVKAEGG